MDELLQVNHNIKKSKKWHKKILIANKDLYATENPNLKGKVELMYFPESPHELDPEKVIIFIEKLLKEQREKDIKIIEKIDIWKGYESCDPNPSDAFEQGAGSLCEQAVKKILKQNI